jgi:putative transposase
MRCIVLQMQHATLAELAAELERQGSVRVCIATIRRLLRAQGIVRLMPERRTLNACVPDQAKPRRYGYTAAHRREADAHYRTDLTDAEWLLVSDLFELLASCEGMIEFRAQ